MENRIGSERRFIYEYALFTIDRCALQLFLLRPRVHYSFAEFDWHQAPISHRQPYRHCNTRILRLDRWPSFP